LVNWFGSNMIPCEKGICLPLGLENISWKGSDYNVCLDNRNNTKSKLLYLNFNTNTNHLRKQVIQQCLHNGFVLNDNKEWSDYIKELSLHKFCICPPGNGIDCHRNWECLYVGCIPIVLKRDNDPMYYYFKHLPILFVEDYSVITKEFLEEQYFILINRKFDTSVLKLSYWSKEFFITPMNTNRTLYD